MQQEPRVNTHREINKLVIDIYQNITHSQQHEVSTPMIRYYLDKTIHKSHSKCLFCDDFSIVNEGLCNMCKYYRYTQPRLNKK